MRQRHLNQFAWFITIAAGLGGSTIACSKEEKPPASAAQAAQQQVFTFAPPEGTEFVRTDRRREEVAVVGAPLRQVEDSELRWRTRVDREGDEYRVKQDLVYISLAQDGQTLAAGDVPEGISAKLIIDNQGNLQRVEGLERTAEILRTLAAAGKETQAAQAITTDTLAKVVALRYRVLFGDTIGRPATPGSSWTIKNPPGSLIMSRTVTVAGLEPCGGTTCARLNVDFQLDPQVVSQTAMNMVQSSPGQPPSQLTMRNADYKMNGWMLVEPATMLSHGASLTESGTMTLADASQKEVTVEIKGSTELSYSYGAARTSARPSETESPLASE